MKKIIHICFDKWWKPILVFVISSAFLPVSYFLGGRISAFPILFVLFGFFMLFCSIFYQLRYGRWLKAIVTTLLLGSTVFAIFLVLFIPFMRNIVDGDHWADSLTIPAGIQLDTPGQVDMSFTATRKPIDPPEYVDTSINQFVIRNKDDSYIIRKTAVDLVLYQEYQPGIYTYNFWIGKIGSGKMHLRAFEITHNTELSDESLAESSALQIYNPTDSIKLFYLPYSFTIYEGDWGKPYAARFEVWYKADTGSTKRKLFQKNFRVEGWMH
ncbi:MAG: hypothetical protein H7257_14700 [Taibaiella sp.]|nr:hypothetical protein [Taibaiella sp.]